MCNILYHVDIDCVNSIEEVGQYILYVYSRWFKYLSIVNSR